MPELPEVETTRRGLESIVLGTQITHVTVRRRDLRRPIPKRLEHALEGATITQIRRRAKYLLLDLDTEEVLLMHLGMSGSVAVRAIQGYSPATHDHVLITLQPAKIATNASKISKKYEMMLVFHDPRRFGVVDLFKKRQEAAHPMLRNLGPEPFSSDFSPAYLSEQLRRRKGSIKPALMDQALVVGVGNIYASEALYYCGIHPSSPAQKMMSKSPAIIEAIRATLEAAIASGGSTLRNYANAENRTGYFQHRFQVYERDGEPCFTCNAPIQMGRHGGRASYWCSQCQQIRATRQKR